MGFCDRGNGFKKSHTAVGDEQRARGLILTSKSQAQLWLKKEMLLGLSTQLDKPTLLLKEKGWISSDSEWAALAESSERCIS